MIHPVQTTSLVVRLLYGLTVLGNLLASRSFWVTWLTAGGWFITIGLVVAAWALLALWRTTMVLWKGNTLDAPPPRGIVRGMRWLGIAGMVAGAVGLLASVALPWALAHSRALGAEAWGAVGFVTGMFGLMLVFAGTGGLTLFELSRLLSFEQQLRNKVPAAQHASSATGANHVNWRPGSARRSMGPTSLKDNV